MAFLSVVLWPILPRSMAVIGGTLYAAATGLGFLRDWFVASGVLNPANDTYRRTQAWLYRLFARLLPPLWRLALVIAMTRILAVAAVPFPPASWSDHIAGWGVPGAPFWTAFVALIGLLGTPLVGLGILSRVLSTALILPIGFDIATRGLDWANGLALVSTVFIQMFGPGPGALWPGEERFVLRRLGDT